MNAVELTNVDSRVHFLEQSIVAGVANASTATTDTAQDDASALTGTVPGDSGTVSHSSAAGYLRNRRNNQGNQPNRN